MKPEQSVEIQYLMTCFFDGSISPSEFDVLNRSMKESDTVRDLYFRYLKVYLALKNVRYLDRSGRSDLDLENFLCELGRYEHLAPAVAVQESLPQEGSVCLQKLHIEKPPYQLNKYSFYTALTALAATILIIATIYFLPPRIVPEPVARILESAQAEWTQEKTPRGRSILFAGSLKVTQGTLKFAMYDGTEVSLDAPAAVELEQIDRLFLHRGQMRATVPPVATGFTVCTPSGSVVDYGTEFTIAVDTKGKTVVEVYKGIVELRDSSNPLLFNMSQRLTVGQTGTIDPAGKISYRDAARPDNESEIRVQWECPEASGRWNSPSFWTNGLVRSPALVSEFRAVDAPKTIVVDSSVIASDKIIARRADVGLLSRYPVTVKMTGGQIQLEQLWVGRMGQHDAAEGKWLMSDGELVLKGRDLIMLFVGDKCKGLMEISGGSVEVFGTARVGCNEGDGIFTDSDGTLAVNGGTLTIYGILEVAVAESVGAVRLNGGVVRAFDVHINETGVFLVNGGTLVLEGDKTEQIRTFITAGRIRSEGHEIQVEYDGEDLRGFGRDKTILSVKQ